MKNIFAFLMAASLSIGASAQLVNAFHEVAYTDGDDPLAVLYPAGATTYRIYASLGSPADVLSAVYAVGNDMLILGSDSDLIWNSQYGAEVGSGISAAFFPVFPSSEWDSFVTVGRANDSEPGVGVTALAITPSPSAIFDAFTTSTVLAPEDDPELILNDGNWFSTPGAVNTVGTGIDNRVLLAQVTCVGDVQYQLNVQVLVGGLGGTPTLYIANAGSADPGDNVDATLAYPSVVPTGCTDMAGCNYNPAAVLDDGLCDYSCYGCTDMAACNWDVTFTIDDGSCDYSCYGCTDMAACNFDATATINSDGTYAPACFYVGDACDDGDATTTDDVILADCSCAGKQPLALSPFGSCSTVSGSVGASPAVYTITPASPGMHLEVITSDFDAQIDLDGPGFSTDFSINDVAGVGNEIFTGVNLMKGNEYTITISSNGGTGNFTVCASDLPETKFDYASGNYDLCDIVKADWVGAENYRFRFIPFAGPTVEYITGGANTFALLRDIDGLLPGTYFVRCDAGYNVITTGIPTPEFVWVLGDTPVTVNVVTPQNVSVRASDNCTNHGPHFFGDYIAATPYSCGVTDWVWTFTPSTGGLPIVHNRGNGNRYLRLSAVAGLSGGGQYDVTVQGTYDNGASTNVSAVECISIIGVAPTAAGGPEVESDAVVLDRVDDEVTAAIYPNPSTGDVINVNLNNVTSEKVSMDIYDSFGKLVQSQQLTVSQGNINQVISVSNLASGVYMVNIGLENQVITERFVIQK